MIQLVGNKTRREMTVRSHFSPLKVPVISHHLYIFFQIRRQSPIKNEILHICSYFYL